MGAELLHKELALTDVAEKWSRGSEILAGQELEAGLIWNVCGSTDSEISERKLRKSEFVPTKWMGVKTGRGCLVIFTVTLSLPSPCFINRDSQLEFLSCLIWDLRPYLVELQALLPVPLAFVTDLPSLSEEGRDPAWHTFHSRTKHPEAETNDPLY